MPDFVTTVFATLVSLLPICNPPSTAVLFLTMAQGYPKARQNQQAMMASIYMAAVLLAFFFGGAVIMTFFGISLPGVRIAGGLIIAGVGFGMLKTDPPEEVSEESKQEAQTMRDIAFTPLAIVWLMLFSTILERRMTPRRIPTIRTKLSIVRR